MAVRTMFPTLADVPRDQWPTSLHVHPAPAHLEGSQETIQCACTRTVPADEMIDLRELSASQLRVLGLTTPVECRACFHEHVRHGRALHSDVARAIGLHTSTTTALEAGEREGLRRGWCVQTARNAHLAPSSAPILGGVPTGDHDSGGAGIGLPTTLPVSPSGA
jgi:hypothetical protein